MDFFAHGFWTNAVYEYAARTVKKERSKKDIWTAIFFGVAPDIFSFGFLLVHNIITRGGLWPYVQAQAVSEWSSAGTNGASIFPHGPPDPSQIPAYVHVLYNWTHSLVVFAAAFLLIWLFRRKPYWLLAGWGLHIGVDIFSHTDKFFPTPFLFPVSNFHVSGISWANPYFMLVNYSAIIVVYTFLYWKKKMPWK